MDSPTRLKLASRISYYTGGVLALLGATVHFGLGSGFFHSVDLTSRNLLEGSLMFFLISAVSVLRAGAASKS